MSELPFEIRASKPDGSGISRFFAVIDGEEITSERYKVGDGTKRRTVAALWAADGRLCDGRESSTAEVISELEAAEREAEAGQVDDVERIEVAVFADADLIVELTWNLVVQTPDFIVYDRATQSVRRAGEAETSCGTLVVPSSCGGIVTPGRPISGSIYLPTHYDETGLDESKLRESVGRFIHRYVELPHGAELVAVEYVFLTWVFDAFDELPYLAFRTADLGRGKSRALETVGALCYRPTFCGGGSSAAAVRRLVDTFQGTLIADEFDGAHDTELTATITKILNQGFQKNRPLVCCVGEDNQPKAFSVFGPKIFALRKGFGDDATESRTLSVTMRQRTRKDVPLNLPREAFDREALSLRNRLLAWRCGNLGRIRINPALADSTLEDRANQIGLPLLAVAPDSHTRREIIAALKGQQATIAAVRAETVAGEVLVAILAIGKPGDEVRPGDVATIVNRRRAVAEGVEPDQFKKDKRAITAHKVGRTIRDELELPAEPKDNRGARYRLDETRLREICGRFAVPFPETSLTSQSHSSPETSLEKRHSEAATAVSDVGDDGDVFGDHTGVSDDGDDPDASEREGTPFVEVEAESLDKARLAGR